jgi:hypothetical protein
LVELSLKKDQVITIILICSTLVSQSQMIDHLQNLTGE